MKLPLRRNVSLMRQKNAQRVKEIVILKTNLNKKMKKNWNGVEWCGWVWMGVEWCGMVWSGIGFRLVVQIGSEETFFESTRYHWSCSKSRRFYWQSLAVREKRRKQDMRRWTRGASVVRRSDRSWARKPAPNRRRGMKAWSRARRPAADGKVATRSRDGIFPPFSSRRRRRVLAGPGEWRRPPRPSLLCPCLAGVVGAAVAVVGD